MSSGSPAFQVRELVLEYADDGNNSNVIEDVHQALDQMGYSMGVRAVDEFLALIEVHKQDFPPAIASAADPLCTSFEDTILVVAKVAFRCFLGVTADIFWPPTDQQTDEEDSSKQQDDSKPWCTLLLYENPLATFVELPPHLAELEYSYIFGGIIRGALEQLNYQVECSFIQSQTAGDEVTEIKVQLLTVIADMAGDDYQEE